MNVIQALYNMAKVPSSDLFLLIKSLTTKERKLIGVQLKTISKETGLQKLYAAMCRQVSGGTTTYNHAAIKAAMPEKETQLSVLKNQLHDKVLHLLWQNTKPQHWRTNAIYRTEQAQALLNKGLYSQAQSILQSIKEEAAYRGEIDVEKAVVKKQLDHHEFLHSQKHDSDYRKFYTDELLRLNGAERTRLQYASFAIMVANELFKGPDSKDAYIKAIKISKMKIFTDKAGPDDFRARVMWLNAKGQVWFILKNGKETIATSRKFLQAWTNDAKWKKIEPLPYNRAVINHLHAIQFAGNLKEKEATLGLIDFHILDAPQQKLIQSRLCPYELGYLEDAKRNEALKKRANFYLDFFESNADSIEPQTMQNGILSIANAYVGLTDYTNALRCFEWLYNNAQKEHYPANYYTALLWRCLLHIHFGKLKLAPLVRQTLYAAEKYWGKDDLNVYLLKLIMNKLSLKKALDKNDWAGIYTSWMDLLNNNSSFLQKNTNKDILNFVKSLSRNIHH